MSAYLDYTRIHLEAAFDRGNIRFRDDDGLTTTELAILIAAIVVIAVAAAAIFYNRAIGFAESIPDNVPPPGP